MKFGRLFVVALSALLISGHAVAVGETIRKHTNLKAQPKESAPVGKDQLSEADRVFITKASGAALYKLEVSAFVIEKGSDPSFKDFARSVVRDHTLAKEELTVLATAHGGVVASEMPMEKRVLFRRISALSGPALDKVYRLQVGIKDQREDIVLYERQAKTGNQPELRQWAAKMVPILKVHFEQAKGLTKLPLP